MRRVLLANRPLVLAVLFGFGLWILLQLIERAFWVLLLILLAVLTAIAMMPMVRLLENVRLFGRWYIPRAVSAVMIYVAGGAIFALAVYLVQVLVLADLIQFFEALPGLAARLAETINGISASLGIPGPLPSAEDIVPQVQGLIGELPAALALTASAVGGVVGFFFRLFLVLTLAVFLVIESDDFFSFILSLFPREHRAKVADVSSRIGYKIGRWVLGQITVATIAGVLAGLAAALFGLPYPVLIGLGTMVLDLAPAVGPGLMAIPVFFLGLSQSLFIGIAAALVFLVLSIIDGNVLSPLIMGRAVQLSPAVIIIAATLGVALYGVIGALVAIPIAMAFQVFTDEVFIPWLKHLYRDPDKL